MAKMPFWAEESQAGAYLLRTCFAVQLEQRDVVVESLRVVVVVDVGGGHADGLGAGRAEFLREVVVADADVYRVTSANDARIENGNEFLSGKSSMDVTTKLPALQGFRVETKVTLTLGGGREGGTQRHSTLERSGR